MLPAKYSFLVVSRRDISPTTFSDPLTTTKNTSAAAESSVDDNKRLFLKIAGLTGLGIFASSLLPKQAEAYVMGNSPASNVVGLRDITGDKVNPATTDKQEEILTELKLKADRTETQPVSVAETLQVKVNNSDSSLVDPSTEQGIILLRRMVKITESLGVVDNQMRQRVVIDSGSLTTAGTVSTVSTVTTLNQLAGVDSRWQIIDWSRQTYNSSIRANLSF